MLLGMRIKLYAVVADAWERTGLMVKLSPGPAAKIVEINERMSIRVTNFMFRLYN